MKEIRKEMIFIVFIVVILTGCNVVQAADGSDGSLADVPDKDSIIRVIDDSGREITIEQYPKRIVSLAPSNTELLFALGAGDRLVAVADQSDYPQEALEIPMIGGYTTISLEKVIAAQTDMVVAAPGNSEDLIERFRSLGLTVVVIDPKTIDDILEDILLLGRLTGNDDQAELLCSELSARIDLVVNRVADTEYTPKVAHIVWHDPVWVSGDRTFQNEVIRLAGGENIFSNVDEWGIVGLEELVSTNPDFILVSSGTGMGQPGYDAIYNYVMTEPRLAQLGAVRDGRVILVDADKISRGGPRIVSVLEEVAEVIHFELFDLPSPEKVPSEKSSVGLFLPLLAFLCSVLLVGKRV